jgi:hypothetical protein
LAASLPLILTAPTPLSETVSTAAIERSPIVVLATVACARSSPAPPLTA